MESEDLPPFPAFPTRFKNRSDFGKNGIRWGTGEADALSRMEEISREELEAIEMTAEMANAMADFYRAMVIRNRGNGSAVGRIALMNHCAELLRGDAQ
jgi:Arc/MetJ-type ribon-helix-helix transcriptional regulator